MSLAHLQAYLGKDQSVPLGGERDLVERAKRDPQAFGTLYQQHYPMLLDHVYRRTGDVHATEDLVADVFVIVLRTLPRFRHGGIPLRFWLLRIATNVVNRWAKKRMRRAHASLDADQVEAKTVSSTPGRVDGEAAQRALLSLPPKYQAVLSLYHVESLSVKETAAVMGCREGTVRSRLTRARDALRKTLNERR